MIDREFDNDDDTYDGNNPYYSPEKCGLRIVAEIETGGSYEYETTVCFQDIESGELLIAQDSGCSCPTPFDYFRSTADMVRYTTDDELRRMIDAFHYELSVADAHDFIRKVNTARG